ncbi:hypothetical protein [Proteiniclasticum sp. QWL-01]|nr:hypothetical protein [Proteiniclasticum sp. QWL-01]WFF71483.1 hypothetical protein P6M73_09150 [Proteiniclasticum sp. QWL-01]
MKPRAAQRQRARNIIWTAAQDYGIRPQQEAYDADGNADLYWNYVIGATHRLPDFPSLENFFERLNDEPGGELYTNLSWIAIEHALYSSSQEERPVLELIRQDYARQILREISVPDPSDIYALILTSYLRQILGHPADLKEPWQALLCGLKIERATTAETIVNELTKLFHRVFQIDLTQPASRKLAFGTHRFKIFHFGEKRLQSKGLPYIKRISIGSVEQGGGLLEEEESGLRKKLALQWFSFKEQQEFRERQEMESCFGKSSLTPDETLALEKVVCQENHQLCHLHLTSGEPVSGGEGTEDERQAAAQFEKNRSYHNQHRERIHQSIAQLSHQLSNTLLIHDPSESIRSDFGRLIPSRIWRSQKFDDSKIFSRESHESLGNLSIDLLLDASASQLSRQSIIAAQGFIIAESLTKCQIPVKVYSFCNRRGFTILRLFRDYNSPKDNQEIFRYRATGFNRDGLAIRTARQLMSQTRYDHKILLVLSDGKPNDMARTKGNSPVSTDYSDQIAVTDTALEVRKGRGEGIGILCVFTGKEADLPAAKTIYGRSLAHIESPERFAQTVGILLQHELTRLLE